MNPAQSIENSVVSTGSRSSANMGAAQFGKSGDTLLYQLFDHMSHNAEFHNFFYLVANLVVIIQIIAGSIWPYVSHLDDATNIYGEGIHEFRRIVFFDLKDPLYTFILNTVAFIVAVLVCAMLALYFKINHRFSNWIIYPARLTFSFLIYLWIYPLAYSLGNHVFALSSQGGQTALNIVFTLFTIVYYCCFVFVYYLAHTYLFNSAYLSNNPIANFDFMPIIFSVLVGSVIVMLQQALNIFYEWISIVFIVLQMGLHGYDIWQMTYLPFINKSSNVLFFASDVTVVIMDVLAIVGAYINGIPAILLPVAMCVVFVLAIVGGAVLQVLVIRAAKKKLAYNGYKNLIEGREEGFEMPTDDEIQERYILMKLDRSPKSALFYLQMGLLNVGDIFLDFSMLKYCVQQCRTTSLLIKCIRIIALFPSENNLLNMLISLASKSRELDNGGRFLLFQVYKIKLLRQSSSSVSSATTLKEMKQRTNTLLNRCQSFWYRTDSSLATLSELYREIVKTNSRWEETMKDYPNSQNHHEEYSRFLIDVSTQFDQAIKHHHIGSLIESGKNFSVDYCYRSLIGVVPVYLTKQVLDVKGNFIEKKGKKGKASTSHNSQNGISTSFSSSDIDAKMEEEIGRTIIKQAKMRIAFQSVTDNRKPNYHFHLRNDTIINFILGIVCFSVLYFIFQNYFVSRYKATERSMLCNDIHHNFLVTNLFSLLDWGNLTGHTDLNLIVYPEKLNLVTMWDSITPFSDMAALFNYYSREAFFEFLVQLSELSLQGVDVYTLTVNVLYEAMNIILCNVQYPLSPTKANMKTALMLSYMSQSLYQLNNNTADWFTTNEELCILYNTSPYVADGIEAIRESLMNDEFKSASQIRQVLLYVTIIVPVGLAVVMLIPFMIFAILSIHETKKLLTLMSKVKNEYKTEAGKTLLKNSDTDSEEGDNNVSQEIGTYANIAIPFVIWFISFIIIIAFIVLMLLQCSDINEKFEYMSSWSFKHSIRAPISVDIATTFLPAILRSIPDKIGENMFDLKAMLKRIDDLVDKLNKYRNEIVSTDDGSISILGYDPEVDALLSKETCKPDVIETTVHSMYECGSIHQQIAFLENWITGGVGRITRGEYNSTWNSTVPMNIFHLLSNHLIPQIQQLDNILANLMKKFNDTFDANLIIFYVIGIVAVVLNTLSSVLLMNAINQPYQALLILVRRVPPVGVVANSELIDYLLHKNTEKENSEMTTTRAVIHNSNDGILCVNIAGTVDTVNPAVTKTLGYTPEQLLGQHFIILVERSDQEKLQNQLKMMVNKESALNYSDHIICVTDNEMNVPCSIDIFGMTDSGTSEGTINSFVVIIRDESEMIAQQEEAEQAKKQSEDLLYQILPRGIVVKLNQGEKDISFVVPSASIMFIDIVKFSEYSAALTPSEIMGTLSTLFGAFDEALSKYPLLTKIKLIGDVYMCAAGLFNPDDPPVTHAEQMLKFGVDALNQVDETNIKLTANLNVRIGMNTGGPLIAGVLGTDKPVFDIIGDPINIAARLQSTDIAGRIQISQNVYDMVNQLDFYIEPRGEVFLKGKGKTNAFLVRPQAAGAFNFSNQELSVPSVKSSA